MQRWKGLFFVIVVVHHFSLWLASSIVCRLVARQKYHSARNSWYSLPVAVRKRKHRDGHHKKHFSVSYFLNKTPIIYFLPLSKFTTIVLIHEKKMTPLMNLRCHSQNTFSKLLNSTVLVNKVYIE